MNLVGSSKARGNPGCIKVVWHLNLSNCICIVKIVDYCRGHAWHHLTRWVDGKRKEMFITEATQSGGHVRFQRPNFQKENVTINAFP